VKRKKNVTIGDGRIERTTKTIVLGDFFNGERMYVFTRERRSVDFCQLTFAAKILKLKILSDPGDE
jgi:hypothetical protein